MRAPDWQTDDGAIRLYCGDCLDVLPEITDASINCVVTSPPYNTLPQSNRPSGLHAERKTGVNKWMTRAVGSYSDSMPEEEYQEWLLGVLTHCVRVCDGIVWVNHKIRYRHGEAIHPARIFPWPIYSEVIWDRGGSMALNCKRFAPSTEHLLGFGRPKVWNDFQNGLMSVWRIGFDKHKNDHPCAFPVELARRPIESSTNLGEIVLDCFAGSGTTGVACVQTKRRFVGIEKEPKYFDIAVGRIKAELERFPLLESAPKVTQRELI